MERARLSYVPRWKGHVEGFAVNFINKNLWRVEPYYEWLDLYQDAWMIFARVKSRYPRVIDPPHFMRLFQISLANHVHTLATKRTRQLCIQQPDPQDHQESAQKPEYWDRQELASVAIHHAGFDSVEFRMLMEGAPRDVLQLVSAALAATGELPFRLVRSAEGSLRKRVVLRRRRRSRPGFRVSKGRRESTNQYLCRLAGLPPTTDLRSQLEAWLA